MAIAQSIDLKQALEYFEQARNRVIEITTGLSDAQWHFKPGPDRWSVAENLEHIVTVQERVLGPIQDMLAQAPAPPPDRDNERIDAIVMEKVPDRSITAKAPEFIDPTGQSTPDDCLLRLFHNYERLAELVETRTDLRDHIMDSPPLRIVTNGEYTTMDGFQWALTMAAHDLRHADQILEVKAHPYYPG